VSTGTGIITCCCYRKRQIPVTVGARSPQDGKPPAPFSTPYFSAAACTWSYILCTHPRRFRFRYCQPTEHFLQLVLLDLVPLGYPLMRRIDSLFTLEIQIQALVLGSGILEVAKGPGGLVKRRDGSRNELDVAFVLFRACVGLQIPRRQGSCRSTGFSMLRDRIATDASPGGRPWRETVLLLCGALVLFPSDPLHP